MSLPASSSAPINDSGRFIEKSKLLEKLVLLRDEPAVESSYFRSDRFANQLTNLVLDENLNTHYAIAIHGECGEGKTSIIKRTHDLVTKSPVTRERNWKALWFDAWEYERLDPVAALLEKLPICMQMAIEIEISRKQLEDLH